MRLEELKKNWDKFGEIDPLWAILANPAKTNCKWDRAEFFKIGEKDISRIMEYIDSLKIDISRNRALDFGCGVGRLTQALCHHFAQCVGVDIASSMIRLANKYNQHGTKCQYYINESNGLALFEDNSFDFILSLITLQHMNPKYTKNYLKEFLRILRKGGLIVFQLPSKHRINKYQGYGGVLPKIFKILRILGNKGVAQPLPDSAFKAQITLINSPTTMKAGSQTNLMVKIKNVSNITWPASTSPGVTNPITVGNHWRNNKGEMLIINDGGAILPKDLSPSDEVELPLTITAPKSQGSYFLEVDVVQEGVAWFKDKGSEAASVNVDVTPADGIKVELIPKMEMYAIPKHLIIASIKKNGGRIVDVQEDFSAGYDWLSFRYCVTK